MKVSSKWNYSVFIVNYGNRNWTQHKIQDLFVNVVDISCCNQIPENFCNKDFKWPIFLIRKVTWLNCFCVIRSGFH